MKPSKLPQAVQADIDAFGTVAIVTHAGTDKDGLGTLGRVELWNGSLLTTSLVNLDDDTSRTAFAVKASAAHPIELPDVAAVDRALLTLSSLVAQQEMPAERGSTSQATRLVALALDAGAELWHTPDDEGFLTVPVDGHREHWLLRSKHARRWLARLFHENERKAPGSQAVQDALAVLEGRAAFEGDEHAVYTRVAGAGDTIYLDLCNDGWEVVEITATGWRVIADPPVRFRRPRGLLALPTPLAGGSLNELREEFFHGIAEADWRLIASWLVGALRPQGPYAALALYGEQGSGKSTAARLLSLLLDPRVASLRAAPKDARDVAIASTNSWCVAYDNLSHIPDWLSDVLCRLSTGGGFGTRELYSDNEEVLFDTIRPVLFTAIEEVATRGDLLDRAVVLTLPSIPEDQRKPEAHIWAQFEDARPSILGALLTAVQTALANIATIEIEKLPRMADFALWACAAAPALGWKATDFLAAYTGNRTEAHATTLDAAAWYPALQALAPTWTGTAADLLQSLKEKAGIAASITVDGKTVAAKAPDGWPATGRGMSGAVRRIAPTLRAAGIGVTFNPRKGTGRTLTIAWATAEHEGETPSQPSQPSSPPGGGDTASDGCDGRVDGRGVRLGQPSLTDMVGSPGNSSPRDGSDGSDGPSRHNSKVGDDDTILHCPHCGGVTPPWGPVSYDTALGSWCEHCGRTIWQPEQGKD